MSYPHRIRLRGPWTVEVGGNQAVRVVMPSSWGEYAGGAVFRRNFGYPGRIDEFERVWLSFARVADRARVTLNGVEVGACEAAGEFEVTAHLRPRNELMVAVEGGSGGGLVGEVALEVRATAYLRGVQTRRDGERLVVTGEVAGQADGPLELYLVVDRRTAAYAAVGVGPFRLEADGGSAVVVELVRGAVAWYTFEALL